LTDMWAPNGTHIEKKLFGDLSPVEVLFEFGEPLTFVCRDRDGQTLLAHSLCGETKLTRYLLSISDQRVIDDLKAGRLDLLEALRQPRCWIVDFGPSWHIEDLWQIPFDKVPRDLLPHPGAMLTPDLDPLLRLRLVGSGVGPGKTSASDVRIAAQAAESSLRGLARIALAAQKRTGRPAREVRFYSNPPYQYSRAASFEIAFGRPREQTILPQDEEVFHEMGRLLELGLEVIHAELGDSTPAKGLEPEEEIQLLEAIKALTPPTRGGIDRIEVGGRLVEQLEKATILTREDRRKVVERVKTTRKAPRKEELFVVTGVAEEADQGTSTFTLRELEPVVVPVVGAVAEIRFAFEDHLFDAVLDAFNSQERVVVVGERIGTSHKALDLRYADDASADDAHPTVPVSE
jgi:hypothetical protein